MRDKQGKKKKKKKKKKKNVCRPMLIWQETPYIKHFTP
jgi:hypothetical protein